MPPSSLDPNLNALDMFSFVSLKWIGEHAPRLPKREPRYCDREINVVLIVAREGFKSTLIIFHRLKGEDGTGKRQKRHRP